MLNIDNFDLDSWAEDRKKVIKNILSSMIEGKEIVSLRKEIGEGPPFNIKTWLSEILGEDRITREDGSSFTHYTIYGKSYEHKYRWNGPDSLIRM